MTVCTCGHPGEPWQFHGIGCDVRMDRFQRQPKPSPWTPEEEGDNGADLDREERYGRAA